MEDERVWQSLCDRIGYQFKDRAILSQAFVHPSLLVNARGKVQSYQRLEFLGDAVIELLASEELYMLFPEAQEGTLTNYRSQLVNNRRLAEAARRLYLGQCISFTRRASDLRDDDYVLACVFEALAGAMFVDCGGRWLPVRHLLKKHLLFDIEQVVKGTREFDPKGWIQGLAQDIFGEHPIYVLVSEGGAAHKKIYVVKVVVRGVPLAEGEGSSRKDAERSAALEALNKTKDLTTNLPFGLLRHRDITREVEFRRR
jgi:ribonuclease III